MNVVIMKRYAAYNVDAYNRTAVNEDVDLENGCVFKLEEYSDRIGEGTVWKTAQAAATDTGLWMAMAPEVVMSGVANLQIRGITPDPRYFTNVKGRPFDVIKLQKGDIIEMTADGIADADTKDYLVPSAADFKLEAADAAGTGLTLHKIGTSRLHIADAGLVKTPVVTYKYEVTNN